MIGTVRKVTDRDEMKAVLEVLAKSFGDEVLKKNDIDSLCDPDTQSTFYAFDPKQLKLVCESMGVHMHEYEDFKL